MPNEQTHREAERAHDAVQASIVQNNDAAMKSGDLALKTVILVNGGSAVALLAFLGALAVKDKISATQLASVAAPLSWFVIGVAAGFIALLLAYITNLASANTAAACKKTWEPPYVEETKESQGLRAVARAYHWSAIGAGSISLVLFVVGMWAVRSALLTISAGG